MHTTQKPIPWIRKLYPNDEKAAQEAEYNFQAFIDFIASLSYDEIESIHGALTANPDRASVEE